MAENKQEHQNSKMFASEKVQSLGVPARLPENDEKAILLEVRQTVWKRYQTSEEPNLSKSKTSTRSLNEQGWWGRYSFAFAGSFAVFGAFFWFLGGGALFKSTQELSALRVEGKIVLQDQKGKEPLRARELSMHITNKKGALLQEAHRWRVRAEEGAFLQVARRSHEHHTLRLKKGRIDVYVIPKQIRDFEVALPGYHVHVKGTRFVIERGLSGWWIEMKKGRVVLQATQQTSLEKSGRPRPTRALVAGQGAIFLQKSKTLLVYPTPPKEAHLGLKRINWWLKRDLPEVALQWASQRCETKTQERALCADSLQEIAEYYRGKRVWSRVLSLLMQVHALGIAGRSELALPEALSLCRRIKNSPTCVRVYRLSLQQQNAGPFAEHATYWLAVGLVQQKQPPTREIQRLLWRYVRSYPQGQHLPNVLGMLLRWGGNRRDTCRNLRSLLSSEPSVAGWLQRFCPTGR